MNCKYKVNIKDIQYNYKVSMENIQSKYKFKIFCSGYDDTEIKEKINTMYEAWPKVSGEGETVSLSNTVTAPVTIGLKGNTSQATLPSEYTAVDYISSSGTQYINTGIKVSNLIRTEIKYKRASGLACLFGGRSDYQRNNYAFWTKADDNKTRDIYGTSVNAWSPSLIDEDKIVVLDKNKNVTTITVDGVTTTHTHNAITFNANYDIYLFGCNNAGNVMSQYIGGTIYYCKMYDNDTLVRDYIPCYRNSDNEVGLYDLVNGVFYANAGTGTFTKGNNTSIPNPDYPQNIHVVSGDNSIDVCGKNLFKEWVSGSVDGQGNFTPTSRNRTDYIQVQPSTTYTLWREDTGFATYIYQYNASKNYIKQNVITSANTTLTLTTDENTKYVVLYQYTTYSPTNKAQLEVGSTATTYEPYKGQSYPINLGDIELCKIRTYQDSIVKDNGKWYVNKQIGKVVLNGSESWTYSLQANVSRFDTVKNNAKKGSATSNPILSTHFKSEFALTNGNIFLSGSGNLISIIDNDFSNTNDFKNWLSNNNVTCYYGYTTPTYTEITDSTLISQLNALAGAESYSGQTNISQTNDDKPFILTAKALKDLSNL